MNWNLLLLELPTPKSQILLWESFTDIHLWTLLTLIAIIYFNKLLENISKEQISIFLLGDFNVNLLNYNEHNQTNKVLDSLGSNSFIPLILQPIRTTILKKKQLYGPFLWMGFNCLKARATSKRQFTFYL